MNDSATPANRQLVRGALEMTMYGDHNVVYRKGEDNNADPLSRLTDTLLASPLTDDMEVLTATLERSDDMKAADDLCVESWSYLTAKEIRGIEHVHNNAWDSSVKDNRCKEDWAQDYA